MSEPIYIIDDDAPFRAATARLLQLHGYTVAEYESADDFLERAHKGLSPGCILLDVKLPGLSGTQLQEQLAQFSWSFPIVFLTGYGDVPTTVRAIKAGAEDFLTKPVCENLLIESIERALAKFRAEREKLQWLEGARSHLDTLTPREREVFEYVVRGKMNKQTAMELHITERTIKAHRQRIFEKLGARTVADLVSLAERLGILLDRPLPMGQRSIGSAGLADS